MTLKKNRGGCLICGTPLHTHQKKYCCLECAGKGVGASNHRNQLIRDDQYIEDVALVYQELGHYPTCTEYLEYGAYNPYTLSARFGSWEQIIEKIGYICPLQPWSIDMITPEEGGWIAGFFTGEGTFAIGVQKTKSGIHMNPSVSISQRADNPFPIQEMIRIWQLNPQICHLRTNGTHFKKNTSYNCNPMTVLTISRAPIIAQRVIATFEAYPLRSKKQKELAVFKKVVDMQMIRIKEKRFRKNYTQEESEMLQQYRVELLESRKYIEPETKIEWNKSDRDKLPRVWSGLILL
jgi:hypothetical protein